MPFVYCRLLQPSPPHLSPIAPTAPPAPRALLLGQGHCRAHGEQAQQHLVAVLQRASLPSWER